MYGGKFSDSTTVRSHWSRPHNKYSLQYLYLNRLSTIKRFYIELHRVSELELKLVENILTKLTIIITITDKNYNCSNNYEIFVISDYISVYTDHVIDKQISSVDWSYLPQLVQELLISMPSFLANVNSRSLYAVARPSSDCLSSVCL